MFEFLFKYPPSVFSKGTFVLLGSWPHWLLTAAILGTAALLAWMIWRRRARLASSMRGTRAIVVWALQSALVVLALSAERSPLPRPIEPEEVANAAAFLCSPLASAITGHILYVDCGDNVMGV